MVANLNPCSALGRREGWLAEHCLIVSLTSPSNKRYYMCAAFPSSCGKTNLAMLVPTLPGYAVLIRDVYAVSMKIIGRSRVLMHTR